MHIFKIFLLAALVHTPHISCATLNLQHTQNSDTSLEIKITATPQQGETIYKDGISITTAHPYATLSEITTSQQPSSFYDQHARDTKHGFSQPVTFTTTVTLSQNDTQEIPLFVHYYSTLQAQPFEERFTLSLAQKSTSQLPTKTTTNDSSPTTPLTYCSSPSPSIINKISDFFCSFKESVSRVVETTDSPLLRIFFVFLLGLLMSLTPCIYPMIPITVGILQTSTSSSLFKNFLLAFSYTLGIAFTFAILGLLAAFGSTQFGALMGNPIFVTFLVIFLGYLAGTMLGIYEMYIPRFLQPKNHSVRGGSYLSAFIFGAISGSVASPCLSPGLLLLLSIVATVGNTLLGFVWLFVFGLGLGLPLLIIGTFSSSLQLMPQAGLWMVEIKKLFGLMLLSMCFYYLNNILPWHTTLWIAASVTALCGIWYFISIEQFDSPAIKRYKTITATFLIATSFFVAFNAYKVHTTKAEHEEISTAWISSYDQARELALKENKKMLLDFTATWCSACKALEKKILNAPALQDVLSSLVLVKVDCTNPTAECCAHVQKKYTVLGYPTILLIDPKTETVINRWGADLMDLSLEEIIKHLS